LATPFQRVAVVVAPRVVVAAQQPVVAVVVVLVLELAAQPPAAVQGAALAARSPAAVQGAALAAQSPAAAQALELAAQSLAAGVVVASALLAPSHRWSIPMHYCATPTCLRPSCNLDARATSDLDSTNIHRSTIPSYLESKCGRRVG
jgi:hypothetical protein